MIRTFISADAEAVLAIWGRTDIARPWLDLRAEIHEKLERDSEFFLVAEEDQRIVGTVMGAYDGRRGWIYHLAVDPPAQRRGVGRALMLGVEAAMRARGISKINLQVRRDNDAVAGFYEALGYTDEQLRSFGKRLIEVSKIS